MLIRSSRGDGGAFFASVQWVEGVFLGNFSTVVAIISVAGVGYLMLKGRINWRRGATVIVGCFILFGASGIATGIGSVVRGAWFGTPAPPLRTDPALTSIITSQEKPRYDPYAGASVPGR